MERGGANQEKPSSTALMKDSAPTENRDDHIECAQCIAYAAYVSSVDHQRSQLAASLRKAQAKVDRLRHEKEALARLKEVEEQSAKKGDEIAALLREGKSYAENREKQANTKVQDLQEKLDAMKARVVRVEQALATAEERNTTKAEETSPEHPAIKSRAVDAKLVPEERTLTQELEQAKKDLQAANNRADRLLSLLQGTYSLASSVIAATHVLHERVTPCCDELGTLLRVFEAAGSNVTAALQAARSGVRVVVHQQPEMTQVKFLCGTEAATATEMEKQRCDSLVPFLRGVDPLEAKAQVARAGQQLIKRKLESQGEEKSEEAMCHGEQLFQDFTWMPSTAVLTRQEFLECCSDAVSPVSEKALAEQLERLSIGITEELHDVHKKLLPAQAAHKLFAKMVDDWGVSWKKWEKNNGILHAEIKASAEGETPILETTAEVKFKSADTVGW